VALANILSTGVHTYICFGFGKNLHFAAAQQQLEAIQVKSESSWAEWNWFDWQLI